MDQIAGSDTWPPATRTVSPPASPVAGSDMWPPATRANPPDLDRVAGSDTWLPPARADLTGAGFGRAYPEPGLRSEPGLRPAPGLRSEPGLQSEPGLRSGAVEQTSGSWRTVDTGERRIGRPEPAATEPQAPATDAGRPRQSRFVTVGIVLLSVVVLLAGAVLAVVYFSGSDDKLDSMLQLGAAGAPERTVTAPLDSRAKASFEVMAATNRVRVSIGELGDDLYRISTPEDAGILPRPVIRNDEVKLQVSQDGDGTGGEIDVVLAARVQWSLRFSGYAEEQVIDLGGGQVTDIAMVGAARQTQLILPRPSGTVPVRVTAAVDDLTVTSPDDSPVRVHAAAGAGKVVAGTRTLKDLVAGSTLTPKGWNTANRYDLTAAARITNLTVQSS